MNSQSQETASEDGSGGGVFDSRYSRRRLWKIAGVTAAGAAAAGTGLLVARQAEAVQTGTWYKIKSRHSGLVFGISGDSTANGATLIQWNDTGATSQQFRFIDAGSGYHRIQARHSNKVLDVWEWNPDNGATIAQFDDLNGTNQQFQVNESGGYATFINRFSGKALDVWQESTTAGSRISQYPPTGGAAQQFQLIPVGNGSLPPGVDALEGFGAGTTGGQGGQTVTVTNQADLERYAAAGGSHVIRVASRITIAPYGHEIRVGSNKTIVGVGTSGEIVHGGFYLGPGTRNVIIRNLTIRDTRMAEDDPHDKDFDYDGIHMDTAERVWLDHNRILRMNDGMIDSRKSTTNLTISWNVIAEANKTLGIGWPLDVRPRVTVHHNWIHDTNQRNPAADNIANLHLYNNYLQNITGYGNRAHSGTQAVVENSYYQNVLDPYFVEGDTTELVQRGSITVDCTWRSGRVRTRGDAFNPRDFYSYTLHPADQVPGLLRQYAGPQSWITG